MKVGKYLSIVNRFLQKPLVSWLIKFLTSGVFLFLLSRFVDFGDIYRTLQRISAQFLSTFYFIFFLSLAAHALRWKCVLRGWGISLNFSKILKWMMMGFFINIFVPGGLGGDAFRVYSGTRETGYVEKLTASVFYERLISYTSLACLGLGALFLGRNTYTDRFVWLILVGILLALLLIYAILGIPAMRDFFMKIIHQSNYLSKMRLTEWIRSFQLRKNLIRIFLGVFMISVVIQIMEVLLYYLVSKALQLPISLIDLFLFVPLLSLVLVIPITINGIGLREAIFIIFASYWGISQSEAIAFSLAVFSLCLAGNIVGGPLYLVQSITAQSSEPI